MLQADANDLKLRKPDRIDAARNLWFLVFGRDQIEPPGRTRYAVSVRRRINMIPDDASLHRTAGFSVTRHRSRTRATDARPPAATGSRRSRPGRAAQGNDAAATTVLLCPPIGHSNSWLASAGASEVQLSIEASVTTKRASCLMLPGYVRMSEYP